MTDFGQVFSAAGGRGASGGHGHTIPDSVAGGVTHHGLLLPKECSTRREIKGSGVRGLTLWLWMLRARPDRTSRQKGIEVISADPASWATVVTDIQCPQHATL